MGSSCNREVAGLNPCSVHLTLCILGEDTLPPFDHQPTGGAGRANDTNRMMTLILSVSPSLQCVTECSVNCFGVLWTIKVHDIYQFSCSVEASEVYQ